MAGVHDVVVEGPVGEHVEVGVPTCTAQQNHVILIHLADGLDRALVERLKLLVQFLLVLEVVGNRLVHQLIAENHRFVLVAGGDALPDVDEQLLAGLALKQPRIAMAVVDVVTRLTSGAVMHVENQVETLGTTPFHHRIDTGKAVLPFGEAHIVLVGEEPVVERQANGVGTLPCDETDVVTGDVVVLELTPEIGGEVRSNGLLDHQVNHPRRIGLAESEHIALGVEPVAQIGTLDIELLTVRLHQIGSFHANELGLGLRLKPQSKNKDDYK